MTRFRFALRAPVLEDPVDMTTRARSEADVDQAAVYACRALLLINETEDCWEGDQRRWRLDVGNNYWLRHDGVTRADKRPLRVYELHSRYALPASVFRAMATLLQERFNATEFVINNTVFTPPKE